MTTAQRIKDLRKRHRMSQTELSKFVNVSQATVTAWETGRAEPSSSALNKLADFFDVSADSFSVELILKILIVEK